MKCKLLFCLLPKNNDSIYASFKWMCRTCHDSNKKKDEQESWNEDEWDSVRLTHVNTDLCTHTHSVSQKLFECDFDAKQISAKNQMRHEQVVAHIKLDSWNLHTHWV